MNTVKRRSEQQILDQLGGYPFLTALLGRRSRRFALGMQMPSGPLTYRSSHSPVPLQEEEEAALAFAACGITGYALGDLCYEQGGNIMAGRVGRTIASGDAIQSVALVVTNDEGAWLLKRPRDFPIGQIGELVELARRGAFTEWYRRSRVQIKEGRVAPPREPMFTLNVNQWSLYAPGTTYFIPLNDLTFIYINGLLDVLNETTGAFLVDERANFQPAGLSRFARRRGGHLEDDPRKGKVATIQQVEQLVTELVTVEQGMMLQNLALMAQALGLGGFPNFATHEFGWCQALGFRMTEMPASRYLGTGRLASLAMKLLKRDPMVPLAVGLEHAGEMLLKPFCPPCYSSMTAAVRAVIDAKSGNYGLTATQGSAWSDPQRIAAQIPPVSEAAIAATIAYCEYVWSRYGRFPAHLTPYRTVLGFQACHLDAAFYDRYYRPEALSETQRQDFARCGAQ